MSEIYRNQSVVERIAKENDVSEQEAERYFQGLLEFLAVAAEAEEPVSPSLPIDAAWHAFILHTRDYAAYCDEQFGEFVHHQPTGNPRATNLENYSRARSLAADRFDALDADVWPEDLAARCHDGTPCER